MNRSKLSEIISIISGGTPKTSVPEYWNGNINWLSVVDFSNKNKYVETSEKTITEEGLKNSSTKLLNKNDIIISARGTVGSMAILKKPMAFNQSCFGLRANPQFLNQDFLFYFLKFYMRNIKAKTQGSIFETINLLTFDMLEITYPSLSIQNKIANILSKIDDKIEINNKLNKELEEMTKTIYDYWFLQFEFPNEEGKPYKSSGGKMVWNEELKKEIPEGWEVINIKNSIKHIKTGLNPRNNFKLGNGNIKYITVKNLTTSGNIDFSNCDLIDEKAKQQINKRSEIRKGDILFASIAPLGRCFIIQETPKDWEINESVFSIRPDYDKISSEYLYMFFMSEYFIKKAEASSTGSIFSGIRINTIENMKILIPDKKIIDSFTDKVNNLFYNKFKNNQENQELTSLRDYLLPLLMNGQVGFKD